MYGGDVNFDASTSPVLTQTVNAAATTTVTLTSQTNPSQVGLPVVFKATVASNIGIPTGTVMFQDSGNPLGSGPITDGTATFSTAALFAGTHNISAVYGGDGSHPGATSNVVQQQVNQAASSVALTADINPSNINQLVTFHGRGQFSAGTPTGTITFRDGGSHLATVPLTGGAAKFSTPALGAGSHSITAVYGGNSEIQGSTSHVLTHVVNSLFPSSARLTSSPNPSTVGQTVMFTVTVTSPGGGTPTGTVTLSEGVAIYGSGILVNGVSVIHVNTLTAGPHVIAATYGGDSTHTGATSPTVQQQVN